MSRRKGEITPATIDRMYPHQVALLAELSLGKLGAEQDAFCHGKRLLRCERMHFIFHEDRHYNVHCFATKAHAETFMEKYGGEPFDPKERGKGVNWNRWYRNQAKPE
ncbi:hypothetical protein [Rhizobium sp. Rhizsp82]|uniref:hypothetical protein n=1 Tax=Rhizobium sp. Rhizsp82 TaxID=3243057 RepID=UPI0039B6262E